MSALTPSFPAPSRLLTVEEGGPASPVLVVSDDIELGALLALNLRRRGLVVEQTTLALALAARWQPAHPPVLVLVDIERPGHLAPDQLRALSAQPWARTVLLCLAADRPERLASALLRPPAALLPRPAAVSEIVRVACRLIQESRREAPVS